jgi:deazaflavin-dependent oxidoreductase (nitroreductase family)
MSATLVRLSMRLNPMVSAILQSPLHWLLSPGLMLITVTGRKSGRRYTIPVGYHDAGDAIVVMVGEAPSKQWWRNYRTAGPIEVQVRRRWLQGQALVLPPDSLEFRERADASFRRSRLISWMFGIAYDARAGLTDAQVRQVSQRAAIVRITVEDEQSTQEPA